MTPLPRFFPHLIPPRVPFGHCAPLLHTALPTEAPTGMYANGYTDHDWYTITPLALILSKTKFLFVAGMYK
jgi:hypothetical protein